MAPIMRNKYPPMFTKDGQRIYRLGEEGCKYRYTGEVQDFKTLRAQCLSEGKLFDDPEFVKNFDTDNDVEWCRAKNLAINARLYDQKSNRFDINQGNLGDCWLLSSLTILAENKKLFLQVCPDDQDFEKEYAGIFHFRFWKYGQWIEIVIDDFLPSTYETLICAYSVNEDLFWSPLLEKAYAKLYGGYKKIIDGENVESLTDLTGGVTETFVLENVPENFYTIMFQAHQRGSLLCCATYKSESISSGDIPRDHAFTITDIQYATMDGSEEMEKIPLIRIRNPWGIRNGEWTGKWSDKSDEWKKISESMKDKLKFVNKSDGEFWISYDNFLFHFDNLTICHWNVKQLDFDIDSGESSKTWELVTYEGKWIKDKNAGGPRSDLESFCKNPQYTLELVDPDENDDEELCTVIIALMSKDQRLKELTDFEVGFVVYKQGINDPKPLSKQFFQDNSPIFANEGFRSNEVEVSKRLKLSPGNYYIILMTKMADTEGEYLLRIFTEKSCSLGWIKEENCLVKLDDRIKDIVIDPPTDLDRICWLELNEILDYDIVTHSGERFPKDACRSMISMMDNNGNIDSGKFKELWQNVQKWKMVFKLYDKKSNGCIPLTSFRNALYSAGFSLDGDIMKILAHRHCGSHDGEITLEDFLICAFRLKNMFEDFSEFSKSQVNFTLDNWLKKTITY